MIGSSGEPKQVCIVNRPVISRQMNPFRCELNKGQGQGLTQALQTFLRDILSPYNTGKHLKHYLVSHTAGQSCKEQSLVFVEIAVFSRLVKVHLFTLALSTAGWCAVQLWFSLDNSLRSVRGTGLLWLILRLANLCQCPGDRQHWQQESWAIAKLAARCALYVCALKIIGSPWLRPRLLFPKFLFKDFCSDRSYCCSLPYVRTKFEVHSFIRSWYNRGYPKKFWQSLDTLTLPFLWNFNGILSRWTLWMHRPTLKSISLPVPEIIAMEFWLRAANLGEQEAIVSRGWYRSKERWWVPIGPP